MDWKCTSNYVKSFAEAEGIKLRISWRVNGFLVNYTESVQVSQLNGLIQTLAKLDDASHRRNI